MTQTPNTSLSPATRVAFLAFTAALAACGGGGGSDPSQAASQGTDVQALKRKIAPAPSPPPPPAPAPAPATSTSVSTTCGLSNFANETLQRINAYRAQGASCGSAGTFAPAAPLAWNTALTDAAVTHATDMAQHELLSHYGTDGSTGGQRITNAGYAWNSWGENIGWGFGTVQIMVDWWMASPDHCANIMKPTFKDVGMACVKGSANSTYQTYWTMDLATPR